MWKIVTSCLSRAFGSKISEWIWSKFDIKECLQKASLIVITVYITGYIPLGNSGRQAAKNLRGKFVYSSPVLVDVWPSRRGAAI
jgi:hypothetical protein